MIGLELAMHMNGCTVSCMQLAFGAVALTIAQLVPLSLEVWVNSSSLDEPGMLASGLAINRHGYTGLYSVNPPLIKSLCAAPMDWAGANEDFSATSRGMDYWRRELDHGKRLFRANQAQYRSYLIAGRWIVAGMTIAGTWMMFLVTRHLAGNAAGLFAAVVWGFSPAVIGRGTQISNDVPVAILMLVATAAFLKWLRDGYTWSDALAVGFLWSMAVLTKFSALQLPAVWIVVAAAWFITGQWRRPNVVVCGRILLQMLSAVVIFVVLANVCYGFSEPWIAVDKWNLLSRGGQRIEATFEMVDASRLVVPLPSDMIRGIDLQLRDLESVETEHASGWFYPYAFWVKEPHGYQLLLLVSGVVFLFRRDRQVGMYWVAGLTLLFMTWAQDRLLGHYRYWLPGMTLLVPAVAAPFAAVETWWRSTDLSPFQAPFARRALPAIMLLLAGWQVYSVASSPFSLLAYANELCGGGRGLLRQTGQNCVDTGQDFYRAKDYVQRFDPANTVLVESSVVSTVGETLTGPDSYRFQRYTDFVLDPQHRQMTAIAIVPEAPNGLFADPKQIGWFDAEEAEWIRRGFRKVPAEEWGGVLYSIFVRTPDAVESPMS